MTALPALKKKRMTASGQHLLALVNQELQAPDSSAGTFSAKDLLLK